MCSPLTNLQKLSIGQIELLGVRDVCTTNDSLKLLGLSRVILLLHQTNDVLDAVGVSPDSHDPLHVHKVVTLDDDGAIWLLALDYILETRAG